MSTLLKVMTLFVLAVLVFLSLLYFSFPVDSLKKSNPSRTALMKERGVPIHQQWVPLSRISPLLRRMVVVAEDGGFYRHQGVDFHEMKESLKRNVRRRKFARGFSTMTMQLARNLYLSPKKTIGRKILEIFIAWRLERELSKNRILEIYLNVIEWGSGIYGVEAASQHYFQKSADMLSAEEAAFLVAIIPSPRKWGRWPPSAYVQKRQRLIMARAGITPTPIRPESPESLPLPEEMFEEMPENGEVLEEE